MFSGLWVESPKTVICTVRSPAFSSCKTGFARCERLFWVPQLEHPKTLLTLSLSAFWLSVCWTLVPQQRHLNPKSLVRILEIALKRLENNLSKPNHLKKSLLLRLKKAEGCDGLEVEIPGVFPNSGRIFLEPFSFLEVAQTRAGNGTSQP